MSELEKIEETMETTSSPPTPTPATHPAVYRWTKRRPGRKSDLLKAQGHTREDVDPAPRASLLLHHLGGHQQDAWRGRGPSAPGMCRIPGSIRCASFKRRLGEDVSIKINGSSTQENAVWVLFVKSPFS